jgi:hypothetical protein
MTPKMIFLHGTAAMALVTGAFVYHVGAVWIDVREKHPGGEHVRLVVPAIIAPIAAMMVPKEKLHNAPQELQQWMPTIEAATEELSNCPDTVFVQVESRNEHVKIAKVGDHLVIDVDDPGETVHVSFPIRAVAYTARQLVRDASPPAREAGM